MLRKTNPVEIKINVACIVGGEFFLEADPYRTGGLTTGSVRS